jgi:F0F1-type ATP synthase assembly protein I
VENAKIAQEKAKKTPLQQALLIGWELGYSIAIPLVLFALGGRLLDRHYGTSPLFLLIGVLVSLVSTSLWLTRIAKRMLSDIEKNSP